MKRSTKRKPSDLIAAIIIGCVFIAAVIYISDIVGIPKFWLEKDIRSQQKISMTGQSKGPFPIRSQYISVIRKTGPTVHIHSI